MTNAYERVWYYFRTLMDSEGLDCQALGLAISALERQIPKKPKRTDQIIVDVYGKEHEFCVCPESTCRRFIFQNEQSHGRIKETLNKTTLPRQTQYRA